MSRLMQKIGAVREHADCLSPTGNGARELSIVKTKLDEARLWAGEYHRVRGNTTEMEAVSEDPRPG